MHLILFIAGLASAYAVVPINNNYHETVGIRLATRLKQSEQATDFDGSRVINGSPAPLGAHPHMGGLVIALQSGPTSACGSSLISNTRLVTAAHCWRTPFSQATMFTVVLGSVRLFSGGIRINTNQVRMHENYNDIFMTNDVAVITIPWVIYTNVIQPINLASGSNTFNGVWATVAGFGMTGVGVSVTQAQILSHVNLRVITNEECTRQYGTSIVVASSLCTNGDFANPCSSDSGGPLIVGSGSSRLLIGIVSFAASSCGIGYPVGYARVTSFESWIRARM